MPVGKRRKSSQSECSVKEKQGVRMTTDPSNVGVDEKQGTTKDAVALPSSLSQQRAEATADPVVSGPSKETEKSEEAAACSLTAPVMPIPAQVGTRSSTRVIKRPRRDTQSPTPSPVKKQVVKEPKAGTPEIKTKRQWELWGNADKNTFFDGLYEYGKDFDAIQSLIAQRCKRKSVLPHVPAIIKNKDQVRHFYYRTWHKISKYVNFSEGVKKQTQELYGLINYGELRKKIGGSIDERYLLKLNQLIHKGSMYVRIKGKNHRIRTPVCNALKKLNQVEEPKNDTTPKVPTKLTLEIAARTNAAWAQVQEVAQNPRLRISLKSSQRLADVISFLEKKWKTQRLRIKENLNAPEVASKQLTLFPHRDSQIHPVSLKTAPVQMRPELHFDNYKENVLGYGVKTESVQKVSEPEEGAVKSDNSHSGPELAGVTSPEGVRKNLPITSVLQSPGILLDDENAMFPDDLIVPSTSNGAATVDVDCMSSVLNGSEDKQPFNSVISQNFVSSASHNVLSHNENATDVQMGTSAEEETTPAEDPEQIDYEERIRKGWSFVDCENLTLAEMYLMFGEGGKLKVEYEWCEIKPSNVVILQQLTNLLRRLIHLASTEFTDFSKVKPEPPKPSVSQPQPLCHKCSAPITSGVSAVKPAANKNSAKSTASKSTTSPNSNKNAKKTRAASPESRDPVFRVPASVLTQGIPPQRLPHAGRMEAVQADMLLRATVPYAKKNRGPLRKPMIVKRRLLPKAHIPGHQLMTLTMVPSSTMAGTAQFLPMGQTVTAQTPAPVMNSPCIVPRVITPMPPVLGTPNPVLMDSAPSISLAEQPPQPSSSVSLQSTTCTGITNVGPSDSAIACQLAADLAEILPSTSTQGTIGTTMASDVVTKSTTTSPLVTPSSSPTSHGQGVSPNRGSSSQSIVSPPNISSLLDLTFSQPPTGLDNGDKILDMAMANSSSGFSVLLEKGPAEKNRTFGQDSGLPSFALSENSQSLGQSPFKLGELGSENVWLGSEVTDISLSGFLESPEKQSGDIPVTSSMSVPPPNLFSDASRDLTKMDVDSTLQCMLNESSMDYAAKFADIAAQMAAGLEQNRKADATAQLDLDMVQ